MHEEQTILAHSFTSQLERLPNLMLIALDARLAQQAAEAAAQHRWRGSDAVYATIALQLSPRYTPVLGH